MAKKIVQETIPQTDSIEELARFWDTHDITDYDDELEEVPEVVFKSQGERVVSIPLPAGKIEHIQSIAQSRGVSSATLLRDWVLERLAQP
jgi:hypothetical protein